MKIQQAQNPKKFEKDYIKCGKLLIKLKDLELMRIKVLEMKQVTFFPRQI